MPTQFTAFQALNAEFIAFMNQRDAWPSYRAILAKSKGGSRRDVRLLESGGTAPLKYAAALAEVIQAKPILAEFLARSGGELPVGMTINQILDRIACPVQARRDPIGVEDDWHIKGLDALPWLFSGFVWRSLTPAGTLCESENDVRTAVAMILATVGRQVEGSMDLPSHDAVKQAERHMRMSRSDYLGRAIDLWRAASWAFTFGVADRQRIGCSCVLPLQESVYNAIRGGERDTHSCSAAELTLPSQTLFLEAVGHKADMEYASVSKKTTQTVRAIYVQLAALSFDDRLGELARRQPLRILSMAGNPTNEERLKRTGFRPTRTKLAGFDIKIMEMDQRRGWFVPVVVAKLQERLAADKGFLKSRKSNLPG